MSSLFARMLRPGWRCTTIAVVVFFGASGCASWNWRGPGFKDEPKIGRPASPLFPSTKGGGLFGQSTKARQIERNLGIE